MLRFAPGPGSRRGAGARSRRPRSLQSERMSKRAVNFACSACGNESRGGWAAARAAGNGTRWSRSRPPSRRPARARPARRSRGEAPRPVPLAEVEAVVDGAGAHGQRRARPRARRRPRARVDRPDRRRAGIGKSTLMTSALASVAGAGRRVVYVSGEESAAQVRLRAERLGPRRSSIPVLARRRCTGRPRLARPSGPRCAWWTRCRPSTRRTSPGRPAAWARSGRWPPGWSASRASAAAPWSWSGTSPRTGRWPARGCSSTRWTACCSSRASRSGPTAPCAR